MDSKKTNKSTKTGSTSPKKTVEKKPETKNIKDNKSGSRDR